MTTTLYTFTFLATNVIDNSNAVITIAASTETEAEKLALFAAVNINLLSAAGLSVVRMQ